MEPQQRKIIDEHGKLRILLASLREVAASGDPERVVELTDGLANLRQIVTHHFAFEEEGGYMAAVLRAQPHHQSEVEVLETQHAEILARLEELTARDLSHDDHARATFDDVRELVALLEEHESRETSLIQRSVQEDIGSKD